MSRVGTLMVIGAVALLGVAIFLPWYHYGIEWEAELTPVDYYVEIQFKFEELVYIQHENGEETSSRTIDYGWNMYPEIGTVMSTQSGFAVAALLTAVVFLGATLLNHRKLTLAIGAAAIAVCVISAGYLYVNIEDAFHDLTPSYSNVVGFWGSSETGESWGPSLGWYLTVVSAALMLIAAVLLIRRTGTSRSVEHKEVEQQQESKALPSEPPQNTLIPDG